MGWAIFDIYVDGQESLPQKPQVSLNVRLLQAHPTCICQYKDSTGPHTIGRLARVGPDTGCMAPRLQAQTGPGGVWDLCG